MMPKKLYEESNIQGIADAIREQNGTQNSYTVAQMGNAVRAIRTQPDLEALSVTENGNYLPSAGKDGFGSVTVNVEGGSGGVLQPKIITANGQYTPDDGYDGFSAVDAYVTQGALKFGSPVNIFNYNNFKNIPVRGGTAEWEEDSFVLTASSNDAYTKYDTSCTNNHIYLSNGYTHAPSPCILFISWDYDNLTPSVSSDEIGRVLLFYNNSDDNISMPVTSKIVTYYCYTHPDYFRIRFGLEKTNSSARFKNIKAGFIPIIDDPDYPPYAPNIQPLTVVQNGTYNPPSGVDGYAPVTVNVSGGPIDPVIGNWEQGGIDSVQGGSYRNVKASSSSSIHRTRVRTVGMINLDVGSSYEVTVNNTYKVDVLMFTTDGQYVETSYGDRWQDTFSFTTEYPYMIIMFKKNDSSDISPSDFGSTGITIHKVNGAAS